MSIFPHALQRTRVWVPRKPLNFGHVRSSTSSLASELHLTKKQEYSHNGGLSPTMKTMKSMNMRPKPSPRVAAWVAKQPATELFTTSITEAEVFYGMGPAHQGQALRGAAGSGGSYVCRGFGRPHLGFESDAARVFSKIAAHRRALGKPISHADAQIAAIAQVRGAKLATRNVADYEDCGLVVIDPWDGS